MRVLGSVDARRRSYQAVLRRWRWLTAIVMALALTAGLVVYVTHYGWGSPPAATAGNPVAVHAVQGRKVRVPAMRSYLRRPVLWPAAQTATDLGFHRTGGTSQRQQVFTDGKWYITFDNRGDNGGTWKIAKSVKQLLGKQGRWATTDALLNIIGG